MAIVRAQSPPTSGPRAIGAALRDLRGTKAPMDELLGGAEINLSEPLPIFALNLDDVIGPGSLEKATRVGWRYLLAGADDGQVGFADVKETAGGASKFTGLARNRNADRLMQAVHLAQRVAKELPGDCEARILDVPALNISAVWLAGPQPTFIPYIDPERFTKDGIRVEPEFLKELVRSAEVMRQHLKEFPQEPTPRRPTLLQE